MTRNHDLDGSVLLLGGSGMLGRVWRDVLQRRGIPYVAPARDVLDLCRPHTIRRAVTEQFRYVINAAAFTDVDRCESEEALAERINGHAVSALAETCAETGSMLVHYSTDYVFDGLADSPYPTDARRHPINAYGRSKLLGERAVESMGGDHLLIRTSWLYAPWGRNFVRTILSLSAKRELLKVVDDQRGRPTSAEHLVQATSDLLARRAFGTYHVSDGGECTWFEFAQQIVAFSGHRCELYPCATMEYVRPAARPRYSVLDLTKTEQLIGSLPTWQDNLALALAKGEEVAA